MMSLVLWYSMVPFQCLKVWKCIFSSLGFPSFLAVLFRRFVKVTLLLCWIVGNTCSLLCGI